MNLGGMCDVCIEPGHCCREVKLNAPHRDPSKQPQRPLSHEAAEHFLLLAGLSMFRPAFQDGEGIWRFNCTALDQRTGRCTIYAARPDLCRAFAPGSDPLCVHYVPPTDPPPEAPKA